MVGLTGGIASGKSTIVNFFSDLNVPIIDTDLIARDILGTKSPALIEIRTTFGDAVICADGSLDRNAMREIIFAEERKRQLLENILHPRIQKEAYQQIAQSIGPYVIVVVPLLYESSMKEAMDRILVVDCQEETQLQRLIERDNETIEQARLIIDAQASRADRLSIADDIIDNEGSIIRNKSSVMHLHKQYLQLAG